MLRDPGLAALLVLAFPRRFALSLEFLLAFLLFLLLLRDRALAILALYFL